jgi:hypothetical protein
LNAGVIAPGFLRSEAAGYSIFMAAILS